MNIPKLTRAAGIAAALTTALLAAGCGQKSADEGTDPTAALDQRERELAIREAEVNLKEREDALARLVDDLRLLAQSAAKLE